MTRLKDLKKRLMEDPEFREEYARADDEFALIEASEPNERPPNFATILKDTIQNNRLIAVIIIIVMAIIYLGQFTDSLGKIGTLYDRIVQFLSQPEVYIYTNAEANGTATVTMKFFNIPNRRNVDKIVLSLEQMTPEAPVAGNPSSQVIPVRLDAIELSPSILAQGSVEIADARLVEEPNEPYLLAELPFYWSNPNTTIRVKVIPTFYDAHDRPIGFMTTPDSLELTLTNYATARLPSQ